MLVRWHRRYPGKSAGIIQRSTVSKLRKRWVRDAASANQTPLRWVTLTAVEAFHLQKMIKSKATCVTCATCAHALEFCMHHGGIHKYRSLSRQDRGAVGMTLTKILVPKGGLQKTQRQEVSRFVMCLKINNSNIHWFISMLFEKKTIILISKKFLVIFVSTNIWDILMHILRPCELNRRSWVSWWSRWPVVIRLGSTVGKWPVATWPGYRSAK